MMSSLILPVLGVLSAAAPTTVQPVDWEHVPHIQISLESYRFDPASISLRHGEPYVLAFVNKAGGGHNFVAKRFFAAAIVSDADRPRIEKGAVSLDGGQSAEIHLIAPAVGTYEVHCSHFMHSSLGMKGTVVVE